MRSIPPSPTCLEACSIFSGGRHRGESVPVPRHSASRSRLSARYPLSGRLAARMAAFNGRQADPSFHPTTSAPRHTAHAREGSATPITQGGAYRTTLKSATMDVMGTEIPPGLPFGNICAICDDVLWSPGSTPKYAELKIWDVEACPAAPAAAPNGRFILEQGEFTPCNWYYEDDNYYICYSISGIRTELLISGAPPPDWPYFFDTILALCQTDFVNNWVACGGPTYGKNGEAVVTLL